MFQLLLRRRKDNGSWQKLPADLEATLAWVAQEMNKGKGYEMQLISGTSGGGWAFDKIPLLRPKPTDPQILLVDNMVENPVFEKFPEKNSINLSTIRQEALLLRVGKSATGTLPKPSPP